MTSPAAVPPLAPGRILLVHNRYRIPGGEDAVFSAEAGLLGRRGIAVELLEASNDARPGDGSLGMAADSIWSRTRAETVTEAIRKFRPDIVH